MGWVRAPDMLSFPTPPQENAISNAKKTMSAGVNQFTGSATTSVAKGPKGKMSEGSKKDGRGAAGAVVKASTKRPGGR